MQQIILNSTINAPVKICFDLSRSIDLHLDSSAKTNERAIAGVTRGLIGLNETVTWRAKHFGVYQDLTVKITALDFPFHRCDEMLKGAFKSFKHEHFFKEENGVTNIREVCTFEAPFGIIGKAVEKLILKNYLRKFLIERIEAIKKVAEMGEWGKYIFG